jgi:hypothetical protein
MGRIHFPRQRGQGRHARPLAHALRAKGLRVCHDLPDRHLIAARSCSTPQLTPEEIQQVSGLVAEYIAEQRDKGHGGRDESETSHVNS